MKFQLLATLSLSLVAASTIMSSQDAQAKDWRYSVNNRQQRQQTRIYKGIQSGNLTQHEAARLGRREAQLNRQEARYRASGNGLMSVPNCSASKISCLAVSIIKLTMLSDRQFSVSA